MAEVPKHSVNAWIGYMKYFTGTEQNKQNQTNRHWFSFIGLIMQMPYHPDLGPSSQKGNTEAQV